MLFFKSLKYEREYFLTALIRGWLSGRCLTATPSAGDLTFRSVERATKNEDIRQLSVILGKGNDKVWSHREKQPGHCFDKNVTISC